MRSLLLSSILSPPRLLRSIISRPLVRHMGIFDRVKAGLSASFADKTEAKKRELFMSQLSFLVTSPTYTITDHASSMKELASKAGVSANGETDWKSMLRTKEQQAEIDEQLLDLKIAAALTPAEISDHQTIRRREKLRISGAVGIEVARVNRFLDNYEQSATIHKWLQGRKAKGATLPTSMEEFFALLANDKVGMGGKRKTASEMQFGDVRNTRAMLKKMS